MVMEPPELLAPLPPFKVTEPPVVLPSPEDNVNDPPEPRLEEPAAKDESPPAPAEEAPVVSDMAPPASPDEERVNHREAYSPAVSPWPIVMTTLPLVSDPDEPLRIATAPLSPSVAMPVLNERLSLTPATPASLSENMLWL